MSIKTILIIALCILAGLAICLFVGYMGVVPFDGFYNTVAGYVGGFDAGAVISNPATLPIAAIPTISAIGAGLTQISKYKQQAVDAKTQAETQINSLTNSATNATNSLNSATTELASTKATLESTQTQLEQLKASTQNVTQLQNELNSTKSQMQQLQSMYDAKMQEYTGNVQVLIDPVTKQYYQASIIKPISVK